MNPESTFNQLGISPINAIMIMDSLGLTVDELVVPQRFSKLQDVIQFLKQFPEDTQRFLINKAVRGKTVDKLDHMFEYTKLLEDKMTTEEALEATLKEKSAVEMGNDIFKIQSVAQTEIDLTKRLGLLREELDLYTK